MKLTKKQCIEQYAATASERDKLRLAVADLSGVTRFTFGHLVTIKAREVDPNYTDSFSVSVSMRADPLYMIRTRYENGWTGVEFYTESEIERYRDDHNIYWRAVRHALWKQEQKRKVSAAA